MSKDYRAIYEKKLGIKLQPGVSSIHHISLDHSNNTISNLVCIPTNFHEALNITLAKFKKTATSVLRAKCYWLIKTKTLKELDTHLQNYMRLNTYIDLKNVILKHGIDRAIELFGKEFVESIIIIKGNN
jgi:hypothetical protein